MMFLRLWLLCFFSLGFVIGQTDRECPEHFSLTPQTTQSEEICVPDEFVFSVTTQQAGYVISEVIIDNIPFENKS